MSRKLKRFKPAPVVVEDRYYADYAKVPMGGTNPYYCCKHCRRTDPYINGELGKHDRNCKYRIAMENGFEYKPYEDD